jgi:ATP-dependent helicase HepA
MARLEPGREFTIADARIVVGGAPHTLEMMQLRFQSQLGEAEMKPTRSATQRAVFSIGSLVLTGDSAGMGKVEACDGGTCRVRLFYSVADQISRSYPESTLRPAILAPQTRVYMRLRDGNWLVGRVKDRDDIDGNVTYEVALPNSKFACVPESALYVRCYGPLTDPTEVLAWNGMETQFFHDRRLNAMQAILGARAIGRGLTGLLSASVELVPHQVEVARRVLEDPIQRYLLADEVGMGKTIEAGAIIRQCLLENRQARIIVLAPQQLLRQWEQELTEKFHLEDFPAPVEILSFDHLPSIEPDAYDLLIIDEAHHLITAELNASSTRAGQANFNHLARLAHASKRLLLLSATPVIGNEKATLALLHLLDPISYKLEDREAFRQKLERRQEYGRLLLTLVPGAKPFIRKLTAKKLVDTFPDDAEVAKWAAQLAPSDAPDDQARADHAARAVQQHIAETYRLHQRLIRSRRKDTEGWELRLRHGRLTVDVDLDERVPAICDALEEWRYQAQRSSSTSSSEGSEPAQRTLALAHRYARLVEAFSVSIDTLADEWKQQRQSARAGTAPTFAEEDQLDTVFASAFAEDAGEENRRELAAQAIALAVRAAGRANTEAPKVVAFTSSTHFGRDLRSRLVSEHGRDAVCSIFEGDTIDAVDQSAERFATSQQATIMLCDRSGEEGFNFHFAHSIVHLDLPLDPARIEQRIGRVDRFGRPFDTINERIILPTDDENTTWAIWLEVLRNGFHIFDESVSEVQFLLERLTAEVVLALYRNDTDARERLVELVHKELSEERTRLDEQYALDHLDVRDDVTAALSPELKAFEANASEFGHALDGWTQGVLHFNDWHIDSASNVFKLLWSTRTLVPKDHWYAWFLQGLDKPSSYLRATAVANPAVHLLRPGAPLVDTVERYLTWDDRGTAFATWRVAPEWAAHYGSEWLGFRLCYVVEADMRRQIGSDTGMAHRDNVLVANIQRRADAFLPPTLTVLHLDVTFTEVTDPSLLDLLGRPYGKSSDEESGYRDYNLGSRREALNALVDHADFVRLCRDARNRSEELLRGSERFKTLVATATRRAQTELRMRSERLLRRAEATRREGPSANNEIEREIEVNSAIVAAVANPTVRLDAIGFFVVAGEPPKGAE